MALPWFFGGVYMSQRAVLTAALIVPLGCACVLYRTTGESWRAVRLPLLFLAGGCLLGAWQLTETAAKWSPPAAALRNEFAASPTHEPASAPLSIHPPDTRRDLALLIAAAAAFALGAALFAETKPLLALMIALTVSGVAVAGLGLAQRASAAPWHYAGMTAPSGSQPFGPFISRNNAGGFLCICLAAAFGLLLWRVQRLPKHGRDEGYRGSLSWFFGSLDTPLLAAATAAIVLLAGVIGSLSRGSMLAAGVGGVASLLILGVASRSQIYFWLIASGTAAAIALVLWLGQGDAVGARWALITADGPGRETRPLLWYEAFQAVDVYRFFGSGLGTFYYAHAPFQRHPSLGLYRHGENQFVEALVVGGYLGFGLLLVFGLKCLTAVRRLLKHAESADETAVAAAGATLLLTQLVYACFDFGWYLPALMIPLAVWAGALVRRAVAAQKRKSSRRRRRRSSPPTVNAMEGKAVPIASAEGSDAFSSGELSSAARQVTPPAVPAVSAAPHPARAPIYCVLVALLLGAGLLWAVQETLTAAVVELADRGSRPLFQPDAKPTLADWDVAIRNQRGAVEACPDDGEAHVRLAELLSQRFVAESGRSLLQWYAEVWLTDRIQNRAGLEKLRTDSLVVTYLKPALAECRQARELCPFNYFAQFLTAELCSLDEPPAADAWYLARAERLAQGRSDWLFLLGGMHLDAARPERAWSAWRRAWELRPGLGETIYPLIAAYLEPKQALVQVVPDDPLAIVEIARRYLSEPEHAGDRREYFRKALQLLYPIRSADSRREFFRGLALAETGKLEEAEGAISGALRAADARAEWYLELAIVRLALGRTQAADVAYERYRLLFGDGAVPMETYRRRAAELLQAQESLDKAGLRRCGELFLQTGADQEAVEVYRRATREHGDDPEAFAGLANALLRVGEPVKAVDAAKQALALQPTHVGWRELVTQAQSAAAQATPKK